MHLLWMTTLVSHSNLGFFKYNNLKQMDKMSAKEKSFAFHCSRNMTFQKCPQ